MLINCKHLIKYFVMPIMLFFPEVNATDTKIQNDFNQYFEKLNESFDKIANSQSLKDRNLGKAERLFLREMRKNLAYNTFIRTNSKGIVISEAVRGHKIEHPMRDESTKKWFTKTRDKQEIYTNLIKDDEKGRYYLLWAQPILNAKKSFIGTVVAKIDIWDCFYEFSNNVYYPFQIKLNSMLFFSHKWKDEYIGKDENLTVDGIKKVSVTYIPEQKSVTSEISEKVTAIDSSNLIKEESNVVKKDTVAEVIKQKSKTPLILLILLIVAAIITGFVFFGKNRMKSIQSKIENEEQ